MRAIILAPVVFIRLVYQSAYLALGQIWANKTRSTLTTIGIVIGVASVTAVIASLTGLKAKVLADFAAFGANSMYIGHRRPDTGPKRHTSWWDLRFKLEDFDGLFDHCPSVDKFSRVTGSGMRSVVRYGEKSVEGVTVRGIEPDWIDIENRKILLGRPLTVIDEMQARYTCMIDEDLRDELNLDTDCIGQSIIMGGRSYLIVGVLERQQDFFLINAGGSKEYEMYMPLKTMFKRGEQFIFGLAAAESPELVEEAMAEIRFFLRKTRRIGPGEPDTFEVQSIQGIRRTFNNIAMTMTLVAAGIVSISLLVGGVGIMNIMLVSVSERTKEIGLRKAVGARKSAVLTQFLVEAVILSFFGGLIGIGGGYLITLLISSKINFLDMMHIPAWAIILSFGFSGSVGICFGMFPAIKAARLDPIEALRHE